MPWNLWLTWHCGWTALLSTVPTVGQLPSHSLAPGSCKFCTDCALLSSSCPQNYLWSRGQVWSLLSHRPLSQSSMGSVAITAPAHITLHILGLLCCHRAISPWGHSLCPVSLADSTCVLNQMWVNGPNGWGSWNPVLFIFPFRVARDDKLKSRRRGCSCQHLKERANQVWASDLLVLFKRRF